MLPEHPRKIKLRETMAVHRAMNMRAKFYPQSNVTQMQWASYLEMLFCQCFTELYMDSISSLPLQQLSNELNNNDNVKSISGVFTHFAYRFFDKNGFFATSDLHVAAVELAALYKELSMLAPFPYGNSLVIRLFFSLVGEMRGFKEKLGGIDFRRLTSQEVEILRQDTADSEKRTEVFLAAMQRQRDPVYPGYLPSYPEWQDYTILLQGQRYLNLPATSDKVVLYHSLSQEESLIVLLNGRLISLSRFLEILKQNVLEKSKSDILAVIDDSLWVGHLKYLDANFLNRKEIDFIDVSKGSPPLCLSLHPFSHLPYPEHQRLELYLQREYGKALFDMADEIFAAIVVEKLSAQPLLSQKFATVARRVKLIMDSLHAAVTAEIAAKPQASNPVLKANAPRFVMTMGGAGSGKNSTHYFNRRFRSANGEIISDFIFASLDDGRVGNDIYTLLVAAGHHADDYEAVHLWADTRRNLLCDAARQKRMNLLYDGSGIDYKGRYDKIISRFAKDGYHTEIIATDCMLVVPEQRKENYPASAIQRIVERANQASAHYRTLPWRIAINKHIGFPESLLAAFADSNLHDLVLIDNAERAGKDQVIAQMFKPEDAIVVALQEAEAQAKLISALSHYNMLPFQYSDRVFKEENTGLLITRALGKNHVLVITDVERFIDIIEKGQLNPNAHGEQSLTWLKRTASFIIDRIDKPYGISTIPPKTSGSKIPADSNSPRSNYLRLNSGAV